jgi:hypothetical protein
MFTPDQYRKKANDYGQLITTAVGRNEEREFRQLEKTFTVLADNEQWLADNHDKTVRCLELEHADSSVSTGPARTPNCPPQVQ